MSFEQELDEVLSELREMVLEKNRRYGDSALNPLRIFSKANPMEQILVRMDDKLSRLARGERNLIDDGESPVDDLLGYGLLYKVLKKRMERLRLMQEETPLLEAPDAPCEYCCGTGVVDEPTYASRDMARDAGDLSLEGTFCGTMQVKCPHCMGTGETRRT